MTKERPILMSAPMVRATLCGDKTMTRRVIKYRDARWEVSDDGLTGKLWPYWPDYVHGGDLDDPNCVCPYGQVGDRLWVRETWAPVSTFDPSLETGALYRADEIYDGVEHFDWKWKPSIHMPRWASRITLEITEVRVERLNDIRDEDCFAEGIQAYVDTNRGNTGDGSARGAFVSLWESINGVGSWNENPWVWVIGFERENSA